MTSSDGNFRLKDGRNILIDGKDVQRIRILNDIVWEKTKPTTLTLSAPSSVGAGQSFTLTATLRDNNNNGINGNIIFKGSGIPSGKTVKAENGIATLSVSTTEVKENEYTATFLKTDTYLGSEATTRVKVGKLSTVLTQHGESTVYDTWRVGVKLTTTDGTPLGNRGIAVTINDVLQQSALTTNSKGIASFVIDANSIGTGVKNISYAFFGDNTYSQSMVPCQYKVNGYKDGGLYIKNQQLGESSTERRTQNWKIVTGGYQCLESGVRCGTSSTIATKSGTRHKPDLLRIIYAQGGFAKVKKVIFKFDAQSLKQACSGSYHGGFFPNVPAVYFSQDGASIGDVGEGAKSFVTESNGRYSSSAVISQEVTWGERVISGNPIVSIQYDQNQSDEEACIKLTNIELHVLYVPQQTTTF